MCVCVPVISWGSLCDQEPTSGISDPRPVEMSKRSRSSTMPNEVPSLTPNLQAAKVESSVLILSSLGDWDGGKFEGIWFMGSDRKKQGESQEGPSRLVDDTQSHQIDIKKSAMKN